MSEEEAKNLALEKEEYLNKLFPEDRQNLQTIIRLFEVELEGRGKRGALIAVGGTVTQPPPRKDVDLVVLIENGSRNSHREVLTHFQQIREIVQAISQKNPGFQILEVQEPAIDEEFGPEQPLEDKQYDLPYLLKHEGSITVKPTTGLPIEFIRLPEKRIAEFKRHRKDPYVILSGVIK